MYICNKIPQLDLFHGIPFSKKWLKKAKDDQSQTIFPMARPSSVPHGTLFKKINMYASHWEETNHFSIPSFEFCHESHTWCLWNQNIILQYKKVAVCQQNAIHSVLKLLSELQSFNMQYVNNYNVAVTLPHPISSSVREKSGQKGTGSTLSLRWVLNEMSLTRLLGASSS